jgi:hypothetical protein
MQKITLRDRKYFLKRQPFNFCDQFCERCSEMKNHCQVYKEDIEYKMRCLREDKDPNDPKVAFERVGRMLADVREMLEKDIKKMDIGDVSVEIRKIGRGEIVQQDKKLEKHPFFQHSMELAFDMQEFLAEFDPLTLVDPLPWAGKFWMKEMEEMAYYAPLVFVKAARAVHSLIDGLNFPKDSVRSDRLVSAALSYCSMLTIERSLRDVYELIRRDEPIWALRIGKILTSLDAAKKTCLATFPDVEGYRKKIIFHGDIGSRVK